MATDSAANESRANKAVVETRASSGERVAVSPEQARGAEDQPVEGIQTRTGQVNPDSGSGTAPHPELDAHGGSEQGGMAGPIGYFEGEGNEGGVAPLGGDTTKSAQDGQANSQGGVASGAPG